MESQESPSMANPVTPSMSNGTGTAEEMEHQSPPPAEVDLYGMADMSDVDEDLDLQLSKALGPLGGENAACQLERILFSSVFEI